MRLYLRVFAAFLVLTIYTGCKNGSEMDSESQNSALEQAESFFRIYLADLDPSQLEPFVAACPSNERGHQECFYICHVPPGNPAQRRTLILPRPAIRAHLNHSKQHARDHSDYMGDCNGNGDGGSSGGTDGGTDDGGTDGGTDDGGTDGGTDDGGTDNTDDGPIFCDHTNERDLDCDGRDDETGELFQ